MKNDPATGEASSRPLKYGAIVVLAAIGCSAIGWAFVACSDESETRRLHVEEFRVAEPLRIDDNASPADQLETITAVTEPYDDVEAAVEDQPPQLAADRGEVELQCVTVLKEIAYCSGEDPFLETLADTPVLTSSTKRKRFFDRVQIWFESGGTSRDCQRLLEDDALQKRPARVMWHHSSEASQGLCTEFADVLVATDALRWIGVLWEG